MVLEAMEKEYRTIVGLNDGGVYPLVRHIRLPQEAVDLRRRPVAVASSRITSWPRWSCPDRFPRWPLLGGLRLPPTDATAARQARVLH